MRPERSEHGTRAPQLDGDIIAARAWIVPCVYVGAMAYEVLVEGHHPFSAQIVVIAVTALSMAVIAWMALRNLLETTPLVVLASIVGAVHSWAVTCLDPGHDGVASFAISVAASVVFLRRTQHVGIVVVAMTSAFVVAILASCVHDPGRACTALVVASIAALAITASRSQHAQPEPSRE